VHIDLIITIIRFELIEYTYGLLVEHGKVNEKLEYNVTYILISILYIYMHCIRSDAFNAGFSLYVS